MIQEKRKNKLKQKSISHERTKSQTVVQTIGGDGTTETEAIK